VRGAARAVAPAAPLNWNIVLSPLAILKLFQLMMTRLEPPGPLAVLVAFTPATFPDKAFPRLSSRAWVNSLPFISVTENASDFFCRVIPSAVTTTSSSLAKSDSRAIVK